MSVVSEEALRNVEEISKAQAPVDAAQDALNSLIASKRSLDMTKTELRNLGVNTASLDAELAKLNDAIGQAAKEYAISKTTAEPKIQKLRENVRTVHSSVESPVDCLKSKVKTMPLAADTLNMDVQYFPFDSKSQNTATFSAQIASYVSNSMTKIFGPTESTKAGTAAATQISHQISTHVLQGTLVLSAVCTHKNASVLAPFVLDTDKAIKVWNQLYPSQKLDCIDRTTMMKIAMSDGDASKQKFSIISGTTFGSSFVGMVHVLNSSNTSVGETMSSAATSLQQTMDTGAWFARNSGSIGLDPRFTSDVRNLLSQQNVASHITLLSRGVIPLIMASEVDKAVKKPTDSDPAAVTQDKPGQTLSTFSVIESDKNKILNTDSLITALDDYLKKAAEGNSGVPINYYLKDVDQRMLAQMWVAKYFPGQFA
jgi:hypothetical protein